MADVYHMHAELLDEQRQHLRAAREERALAETDRKAAQKELLDHREYIRQERETYEKNKPVVSGKPKKPFGGPGF